MKSWTLIHHTINYRRLAERFSELPLVLIVFPVLLVLASGCANNEKSDAYGQFEATETTISSEMGGRLLHFSLNEGDNLEAAKLVGIIDSTRLLLQRQELEAQVESIEARIVNIDAEIDVQKEELVLAESNLKRTGALIEDGAATQQKLDDAKARVSIAGKRIDALQTQKRSVHAEINTIKVRIDQINDQIEEALIVNPIRGTVLTTFVEPHELVQMGQSLYRIANLDTLILRIYVSGAQLPDIKLGQEVQVLVDKNAEENQAMTGRISWIASEAEFTPEQIQTKEERVNQVYAVKVRVPNPNGTLKLGMPGEINFE